ncbi:ATP-binding ABC transporter (macronuclear) [Tetrahymena thermophila SB210]|uniref:ATP-binding ABC transporter n=1 Tax=Tetrahymena thermophila (strain SB210) TaxID=312017 RepID=Q23AL4_TETTS|nr:ATP-binding ABC transporter [Tetrahymena thermophila SB210]EAR93478.2 ATP-binding ABC transporter [Tetrahymena thermophila SB210]|eukprot:XP_001013723.2 ATP-binding ABC transporter [Tetrahymena thermophila SB210]
MFVFENISFKIKAGQKVVFVGPSGSDKSSIIQLQLRFYTNYEGDIFVDGKNLTEYYYLNNYLQNFGVVSQEPILFNSKIEENIQFIESYQNGEKLKEKEDKQSNQIINKIGEGFKRKVGPKGSQLSGGQKQKLQQQQQLKILIQCFRPLE